MNVGDLRIRKLMLNTPVLEAGRRHTQRSHRGSDGKEYGKKAMNYGAETLNSSYKQGFFDPRVEATDSMYQTHRKEFLTQVPSGKPQESELSNTEQLSQLLASRPFVSGINRRD